MDSEGGGKRVSEREDRQKYEQIKADIKKFIENVRADAPEAGAYLQKHIEMDDVKMTFRYTGDPGRIKLTRLH